MTKDGIHLKIFIQQPNGFSAVPVTLESTQGDQSYVNGPQLYNGVKIAVDGVTQIKAVWNGFGADQQPAQTNTMKTPIKTPTK